MVLKHRIEQILLKKKISKSHNVIFGINTIIDKSDHFDGWNRMDHDSSLKNSFIGKFSYLGNHTDLNYVSIGKYTSIGPRVNNVVGQHPSKGFVSTHPVFYSTQKQIGFSYVTTQRFTEYNFLDNSNFLVRVGNDVWVGCDVTFMDGIKIGDGAIIAAGAVVVSDVPSYAIVGGIPAKVIRYRFSTEDIEYLQDLKWWDKDDSWVRSHATYFDDIDTLRNVLEGEDA